MRLVLGSMTGWVGFALRTKTFNVLPGRPAATERGGHGTRGGWRDKIEADNSIMNSARDLPRRRLLAFSLVGSRSNSFCGAASHFTSVLAGDW